MSDTAAVAIVGMSGRFPGARDLTEFWKLLHAGDCGISDFTPEELRAAGVRPEEYGRDDYVAAKGHLADADRFEPELFGFNRSEARMLDPQHRLLLQTAWNALEDGGYDPRQVPGRTGVYVGGSLTEHMMAAYADPRLAAEWGDMQLRIFTDREFLAPWLSYRLGLAGPSLTVQTACSTSLTAVHLAVQALLLGECDTALAGGVSVDSVRRRGYLHRAGGILSPDGRCRPFDVHAAGTVGGNGVGVLVLRRLEDALAEAEPIRAVVLGSAIANDGAAKVGFTAPSVEQQTTTIVEAWAQAGLDPSAAQYLEMHGTGTDLGDRVEVAAAAAAFAGHGAGCGIGSVKSNIGHLDAAAGVASLIKTLLMLEHRTLVPTANVKQPHPDLELHTTPFRLLTEAAPWQAPADGPRLAGVTGLGIGGTNVHVVLAEAPELARTAVPERLEALPLSAGTERQLRTLAAELAAAVGSPDGPALADVAHTLRTGRAGLPVRAVVLASSRERAAEQLQAVVDGAVRAERTPDAERAEELRAAADTWVRGGDVTWPFPATGVRRVHLPTYPFAGESYGALSPTAPHTAGQQMIETPASSRPGLTDAAVLELLAAALGIDGAEGLDQTYLNVGGDSLMAINLTSRMVEEFGVDPPLELFLEPLSLRELARRIASHGEADSGGMLAALLDEVESDR